MDAADVSGSELARRVGKTRQDISRWASGDRELLPVNAELLAPHLNTTAASLLLLSSVERFVVPLGGRIVGGGAIDVSMAQSEPGIEYEVELAVRVSDATVAYQVVGESMMPVYRPDTVIICRAHTTDIAPHLGRELAVGTVDHGRMLKTVHAGSKPGAYDLESFNATLMRNVEVAWVARIAAIIPADEWRIIQRKVHAQRELRERLRKPSKRDGLN